MNYVVKNPTKIGLYTQQKGNIQTISTVASKINADVICNFQMFIMASGTPCFSLKQEGKVLAYNGQNYKGYGWNNNDKTLTYDETKNMKKYDNFAGCLSVLENGVVNTNPTNDPALLGTRGRTCIGTKANGEIVIYCWPDGSTGACQLSQLGQKMKNLGCVNAVSYDGGGSTQLICPDGRVSTSRAIYNFLYFQLADATPSMIAYKAKVVATTTLNIRKGPNTSTQLMGTVANGSVIDVDGKSQDGLWYHFSKGWIYKAYTKAYSATTTTTTLDGAPYSAKVVPTCVLNIRKGPSSSTQLMGTVPLNTVITIDRISSNGLWYHFEKGWIYKAYTKVYVEPVVNTITTTQTTTISGEDNDMTQTKFNEMFKEYRKTLQDNDCATWSAEARQWAIDNKIFSGDGAGNYMWQDFITREQMAQLLYNFAKMINKA